MRRDPGTTTIEEVAEIFRGYLGHQDGWGDRDWWQVRV